MLSSGMLRCVALVRTEVSEEGIASIIRVIRISEIGTAYFSQPALVASYCFPSSPILFTLMIEALCSSETSVFTRTTQRHISEEGILQNKHVRREKPIKF
jgi:hypothetical protein